MTYLLTSEQLEAARTAARAGEMTPDLYAFLSRLVAVLARTRTLPPPPTGRASWDEDGVAEDVLHSWLEERLLRGALLQALDASYTPRAFSRYLEQALRNFLISKNRERAAPRLLPRTRELLQENDLFIPIQEAASALDEWWALGHWENPEPYQGSDDDLTRAAFSLGHFALVRYSSGERAEPVLSTEDLERFVVGLFETVDRSLTLRHFQVVFERRFAFAFAQQAAELHEGLLAGSPEPTAEEELVIEEVARQVLAQITERQLLIVRDRVIEDMTFDQLSERYGVSRSTADNEFKRATNVMREHVLDDRKYNEILEKVLSLALGEER